MNDIVRFLSCLHETSSAIFFGALARNLPELLPANAVCRSICVWAEECGRAARLTDSRDKGRYAPNTARPDLNAERSGQKPETRKRTDDQFR